MIRNFDGRPSIGGRLHATRPEARARWRGHFRAAVGGTPKRLSRLARLQHVCRLWDAGKEPDGDCF